MESLDQNSYNAGEKMPLLAIKQRWNLLAIGVSLSLLGSLTSILQAIKISGLIERVQSGDEGAAYEIAAMEKSMDPLSIIAGIIGIVAIVFVCMWFYRAGQNLHLSGVKYLNYSPGWYVGWFFIPLVQIVMPFVTTIELWKANASINNPDEHASWSSNKLSPLVIFWYVSFIAMIVVGCYFGFSDFDNMKRAAFDPEAKIASISTMSQLAYFNVPLQAISGICLILFSKKITDSQIKYMNE